MERTYLNFLFDIYGELLTEKEKNCFIDYYQNDLSLAEIAENNNVTRTAIHKTIKVVVDKLNDYEDKLKIYKKNEQLLKVINSYSDEKIKEKCLKIIEK